MMLTSLHITKRKPHIINLSTQIAGQFICLVRCRHAEDCFRRKFPWQKNIRPFRNWLIFSLSFRKAPRKTVTHIPIKQPHNAKPIPSSRKINHARKQLRLRSRHPQLERMQQIWGQLQKQSTREFASCSILNENHAFGAQLHAESRIHLLKGLLTILQHLNMGYGPCPAPCCGYAHPSECLHTQRTRTIHHFPCIGAGPLNQTEASAPYSSLAQQCSSSPSHPQRLEEAEMTRVSRPTRPKESAPSC